MFFEGLKNNGGLVLFKLKDSPAWRLALKFNSTAFGGSDDAGKSVVGVSKL
jgi:hypothetical protein